MPEIIKRIGFPTMDFFDTLTLDAPKITQDGYMAASVRAARVGIQDYLGSEVGKPEMSVVRVYRPESEVFNRDTLNSFTSIPVTNDHPPEAVTADNWKKYATGNTGEDWARDGEFMRVSVLVKDAETIKAVRDGKKQLSCGYQCDLKWEAGITKDGQPYDAIQTNIRGNHLAIVTAARGGPKLKIGDSKMAKMIVVDGHTVEASDAAEIAVMNLQNKLNDARSLADTVPGLQAQIAALNTSISTKDGQIAALTQQVADAAITPAMMDAAITARATVVDAAKKIMPTLDATGKTETEIKKTVVSAKLGDAAKNMDDAAISGAFAAFSVGVGDADPIRSHFVTAPAALNFGDASGSEQRMHDAHKAMTARLTNPGLAN